LSTKLLKNLCRRQDGNSLVEIAMILPILTILLLGTIDIAVLLNQYMRVADSARSAAEANTNRYFNNNTGLAQLVGSSSTSDIPNYKIVVTQYCVCSPGGTQFSCGSGSAGYQACGTYGLPSVYSKATATATLPVMFTSATNQRSIPFLPSSIPVQFVAIARISWTGGGS
jgi:Flp pilus assembly protein TadG